MDSKRVKTLVETYIWMLPLGVVDAQLGVVEAHLGVKEAHHEAQEIYNAVLEGFSRGRHITFENLTYLLKLTLSSVKT